MTVLEPRKHRVQQTSQQPEQSTYFISLGDFNLTLLDHLIVDPGLRMVGCNNKLNAGYAANRYTHVGCGRLRGWSLSLKWIQLLKGFETQVPVSIQEP